jgi:hypothetical protein
MNKIITLLVLLVAGTATAQSVNSTVTFNKVDRPALMLTVPYKESVAEGAIVENLKKTGYDAETKGRFFWKQNKVNGFYTFKSVNLNGNLVDLYFKIDQKSRKLDQTNMYLLVSKGEGNFIDRDDTAVYNSAKRFLDGFVGETASYKHQLDIKAQEETVKDSEKKLAKLKENEKDMEKKIEELQNDLKKNREQQVNQTQVIELEKKKLGEMKAKTTS